MIVYFCHGEKIFIAGISLQFLFLNSVFILAHTHEIFCVEIMKRNQRKLVVKRILFHIFKLLEIGKIKTLYIVENIFHTEFFFFFFLQM